MRKGMIESRKKAFKKNMQDDRFLVNSYERQYRLKKDLEEIDDMERVN